MSRIIRSLAEKPPRVDSASLFDRVLTGTHRARPAGGIAGLAERVEPRRRLMTVIEKLEEEARGNLEEARLALDESKRQAEQIQREAYTAGFEQGERAGLKLSAQKAEPLVQVLGQLIEAMQTERARLTDQQSGELIKIAFAIAGEVVKEKLEADPATVARNVEAALAKIGDRTEITVRVAPPDYQIVRQYIERREGPAWDERHLRVEQDETVGRGGCRVETPTGDIDAMIETQLRVFKTLLWNE